MVSMNFKVPRMDARQSRAWLALVATCQLLPAALDAQLQADSDLTHFEFILLGRLNLAPEQTLRTKQLAEAASATLPHTSKAVTRLESRGFIERRACPEDGRATNVVLTQAGHRAMVLATPDHLALVRSLIIDDLTPAQLTALADALEPIVARLDPQGRSALPTPA